MKTLIIGKRVKQRIKLDNDIFEKVKNFNFIIANDRISIQFESHEQSLKNYIMSINYKDKNKKYVKFKNDVYDFQKDNLYIVEISDVRNPKPENYDVEYKGISINKRKKRFVVYCFAIKYYKSKKVLLKCDSVVEAAQKYNAICDFIEIAGYRNDVEKYELTPYEKEKVKKKLEL